MKYCNNRLAAGMYEHICKKDKGHKGQCRCGLNEIGFNPKGPKCGKRWTRKTIKTKKVRE